jgi:micrococcal nuclease
MSEYQRPDFESPRPSGSLWQAILALIVICIILAPLLQAKENFSVAEKSEKIPTRFLAAENSERLENFPPTGGIGGIGASSSIAAGAGASGAPGLRVFDGDTFTLGGERIRIADIDTPELRTPVCDAEKRLARLARLRLAQLLGDGSAVTLERRPLPDRYGRTLARVTVNGRDVSAVLIREGLAAPWEGKRHSWCCM